MRSRRGRREKPARAASAARDPVNQTVIFVSDGSEWPRELVADVTREGYVALRIDDLGLAPSFLGNGGVKALFVVARPLGAKDALALRECRQVSPETAIVVMTTTPTQPDLKRAFESGATVFLSWPAPPEVVHQALASGEPAVGERGAAGKPSNQ